MMKKIFEIKEPSKSKFKFMFGYPREIKYWMCSDGTTHPTKEAADKHEEMIENNRSVCYTAEGLDIPDVRF